MAHESLADKAHYLAKMPFSSRLAGIKKKVSHDIRTNSKGRLKFHQVGRRSKATLTPL